jgi:hypothetical protein
LIGKQRNFIKSVKTSLSIQEVYKKRTPKKKKKEKKRKKKKEKKKHLQNPKTGGNPSTLAGTSPQNLA